MDHGVYTNTDYLALVPGPLTQNQKEALLKANHGLYLSYQAVSDWVWSGAGAPLSDIVQSLLEKKFEKDLLVLRDQNKISNLELMYFVQLDLDLRRLYAEEEILNIVPIDSWGPNGEMELNTDRLSDLHKEILANIRNKTQMP